MYMKRRGRRTELKVDVNARAPFHNSHGWYESEYLAGNPKGQGPGRPKAQGPWARAQGHLRPRAQGGQGQGSPPKAQGPGHQARAQGRWVI